MRHITPEMRLQSDFSLIDDPDKEAHAAWVHFKKEMKGKQYGYDALNDAWAWFKAGWRGCLSTRCFCEELASLAGLRVSRGFLTSETSHRAVCITCGCDHAAHTFESICPPDATGNCSYIDGHPYPGTVDDFVRDFNLPDAAKIRLGALLGRAEKDAEGKEP